MTRELVDYVGSYGGNCRDCADNDGVCDRGTPCDPKVFRASIEHTIKALEYGIKHGFIENPFTRATPSADTLAGLVRYGQVMTRMMKFDNGKYVLYSEASAVIAAKDAEIERLREALEFYAGGINNRIAIAALKGGGQQ